MRFRYQNFPRGAATVFLLAAAGICGFVKPRLLARPIEFSEPTGSSISTNVSRLGVQPQEVPGLREGLYRSSAFGDRQNLTESMQPVAVMPSRPVNVPRTDAFGRKNWALMSPQERMQDQFEKDILKPPHYGLEDSDLDPASALEKSLLQGTRRKTGTNLFGLFDSRSRTNSLGDATDGFGSHDAFGSYGSRRSPVGSAMNSGWNVGRPFGLPDLLQSGDDLSPDALRERKAQFDQIEAFKRILDSSTPDTTPAFSPPAGGTTAAGNGYGSFTRSAAVSAPGLPNALLTAPKAPTAPYAPLAPGQSSLAPAPAPSKPRPVGFSAPQRPF